MRDLPVRGDLSGIGLPLPPARMPAMHRRRPLKRWHYVGVYGPDVMLCIVAARVAGIPQRWWAEAGLAAKLATAARTPAKEPEKGKPRGKKA